MNEQGEISEQACQEKLRFHKDPGGLAVMISGEHVKYQIECSSRFEKAPEASGLPPPTIVEYGFYRGQKESNCTKTCVQF